MSHYKANPHSIVAHNEHVARTHPALLLKVRKGKAPAKPGIPKAIAYRHSVFDAKADMEAMLEAFGLDAVISLAYAIEEMRNNLPAKAFVKTPLIAR